MKGVLRILGVLMVAVLLLACAPTPMPTPKVETKVVETPKAVETPKEIPTPTPKPAALTERERTLVVAYTAEPSNFDPSTYYDVEADIIMMGVYEPLVKYEGPEAKIVPWLAESWEASSDYKTYTFRLRKGVKFHDGTPFNAEAAKYNVERTIGLNQGPGWLLADFVEKAEAPDEYTLVLHLKETSPMFIHNLCSLWGLKFLSPEEAKKHATSDDPWANEWFKEHACGTGPYQLIEWTHGDRMVAKKFDDYWGGWKDNPNHFETLILRFIPESSTQRMLLERGDIDMTGMPLTLEDITAINQIPGLKCEAYPVPMVWMGALMTQRSPTDNVKVRQALLYAFNYDAVAKDILGGIRGRPCRGILFSPSFEGYDPNLPSYTYDLEKAKQLLTEAGYPNGGFSLKMLYLEGWEDYRRIGEMYQADLAKLGITLEIAPVPLATAYEVRTKKETNPDINFGTLAPDNADTYSWLWMQLHSGAIPPVSLNNGWYVNPKFDALLDAAKIETDSAKRAEMFREAARIAMEDATTIWVAHLNDVYCMRDDVQGRERTEWFIYGFWPNKLYRVK